MTTTDYSCSIGKDQKCIDIYGPGSCCFWAYVAKIPDNRTTYQIAFDAERAKRGWPVKLYENKYVCNDAFTIENYVTTDNIFIDK